VWFGVITLFPELFEAFTRYGVIGRAFENQHLHIQFWNPRDFTTDIHHTVDDRPFGGGPGMVMKVEPLLAAIQAAREASPSGRPKVVYLSPQGELLTQAKLQRSIQQQDYIFIAGRYEGIDERLITVAVDEEWSIGDYVLSGGELPVMVCMEALARLLPKVLGDSESAQQDSFSTGLLDYPHYTRPKIVEGLTVPEVLCSGDHKLIARWRLKMQLGRTLLRRPTLINERNLHNSEKVLLQEFIDENYREEE